MIEEVRKKQYDGGMSKRTNPKELPRAKAATKYVTYYWIITQSIKQFS